DQAVVEGVEDAEGGDLRGCGGRIEPRRSDGHVECENHFAGGLGGRSLDDDERQYKGPQHDDWAWKEGAWIQVDHLLVDPRISGKPGHVKWEAGKWTTGWLRPFPR